MDWIFLSPHFDDAVYSCGGLIWELTHAGARVELWTICGEFPPTVALTPFALELHERWKSNGAESVAMRRKEDAMACAILGATSRHFDIPDCIYRRLPDSGEPLVRDRKGLFQSPHPAETPLLEGLIHELAASIPAGAQVIAPLALGKHVDHRLVRSAADRLSLLGVSVRFYADYPYAIRKGVHVPSEPDWRIERFHVSAIGLEAWKQSVGAYRSQISSFWKSFRGMSTAIHRYAKRNDGILIYTKVEA
jgi:LmbE family N-acetylglucosaminyl deacetylase